MEATACAAGEGEIKGQVESSVVLDAGADGHAGMDVYGSGAKAKLTALARQVARVLPGGTMKLKIEGLDGLPLTLGSFGTNLQGVCTAINGMLPARVVIQPVDVTFPLGIGDVRVFPGFNRALFPGIAAAC